MDNLALTDFSSRNARIDQHITNILGKTVMPMFNALIATSGEHRRELIELREDIENVERTLRRPHRRISTLEEEIPTDRVRISIPWTVRNWRRGAPEHG
ncbi:hypothetical protein ACH5A7_17015 [Streptomyces sp. NPDC018955]|uniref:hypothetical protein n=1 Tax=Streptomyces sp. NPDC018955 TaxID=3365055 RepID=UPI003790B59C